MRLLFIVSMLLLLKPGVSAQHKYLLFGKGGGISGEVTTYKVLKNGKVLKGSGKADITFSKKTRMKKSDARKLFNDVKNIPDSSFSHPGNLYYLITIKDKCREYKYIWGESDYEINDQIRSVYSQTMVQLGNLQYKKLKGSKAKNTNK